jgi:tetratricopeptide (TPR) repeat protein
MFHFNQGSLARLEEAERHFAIAIGLDQEFGAAYGMYARSMSRRAYSFLPADAEALYEKAKIAAQRAVMLNPSDASAHVAKGFALELHDLNAAIASLQEALSLNPDSSLAHFALGRM